MLLRTAHIVFSIFVISSLWYGAHATRYGRQRRNEDDSSLAEGQYDTTRSQTRYYYETDTTREPTARFEMVAIDVPQQLRAAKKRFRYAEAQRRAKANEDRLRENEAMQRIEAADVSRHQTIEVKPSHPGAEGSLQRTGGHATMKISTDQQHESGEQEQRTSLANIENSPEATQSTSFATDQIRSFEDQAFGTTEGQQYWITAAEESTQDQSRRYEEEQEVRSYEDRQEQDRIDRSSKQLANLPQVGLKRETEVVVDRAQLAQATDHPANNTRHFEDVTLPPELTTPLGRQGGLPEDAAQHAIRNLRISRINRRRFRPFPPRVETTRLNCMANEHWVRCGPEPQCEDSCDNLNSPPHCPEVRQHPKCFYPRCICNAGYIRRSDGHCIRKWDCPEEEEEVEDQRRARDVSKVEGACG